MTNVTLAPNAVIVQTNLVGSLDVLSTLNPLWMTAATVADVVIRVGFPQPPGPAVLGPGLQIFRARVRKNASGGGSPTVTMKLYDGDTLVATLVNAQSISGQTDISGAWDATGRNLANIRCEITGKISGGSLTNRRTVEIDFIEWVSALVDEVIESMLDGAVAPSEHQGATLLAMMNNTRAHCVGHSWTRCEVRSSWYGVLWTMEHT